MATPDLLQDLLKRLRASGVSEEVIQAAAAELAQLLETAREHACIFCGRASDTFLLPAEGTEPFPSQWVYCYRDAKPYGLCNLCYHSGHYWGLSELEIAYFKDKFESQNDADLA